MKKFLPLFLTLIILSGSFSLQYNKAYAADASVSAALASGQGAMTAAGIYLTYALTVAGGAAALGSQYADQIKTHSAQVWNSLSDTAKSTWNQTVATSLAAGSQTVTITQGMADMLKTAFTGFGAWLSGLLNTAANPPATDAQMEFRVDSGNYYDFGDLTASKSAYNYIVKDTTYDNSVHTFYMMQVIPGYAGAGEEIEGWAVGSSYAYYILVDPKHNWAANAYSTGQGVLSKLASLGFPISVVPSNGTAVTVPDGATLDGVMNTNLDNLGSGVKEIDLPLDQFLYKDGAGNILDYNPADNTFADTAGNVYTGDVAVDYPIPGVNTSVSYGNPTADLANVTAGTETTFNPTGSSPSTAPDTGNIDWKKLLSALGSLTGVFPFSIPWDLASLFGVLNVNAQTPVFHIDVSKNVSMLGATLPINYKFDLDFSAFNDVAVIGRWALVLIWDIAIILGLRRFTPD